MFTALIRRLKRDASAGGEPPIREELYSVERLEQFRDRYEEALRELIKRKQSGKPIEQAERPQAAKVINLMDALRRSVNAGKPSSGHGKRAASTARSIRPSRQEREPQPRPAHRLLK